MGFITGKSPVDLARCTGGLTIILALAVLFGAAYAVIGFYVAKTFAAITASAPVFDISLLAWLAAGAAALTVCTLRWTGTNGRKAAL
jgi:hypothetical protein